MVSVGAGRYDLKTDIKLVQKRNKDLNLVARTFIRLINETTVKN